MTVHRLAAPNLNIPPEPASLDASESKVLGELHERMLELATLPGGPAAVTKLELTPLLERDRSQCRVSDLAVAVHRLEALLADDRAPLPTLDLMDDGDAQRNPGFDGVELEAVAEEAALMALRSDES